MCSLQDSKGFTLVEVLVAITVLSIGLLGMAGLTTSVMRGNSVSNRMTTAITLSQDKMEDIRRLGHSGTPKTDTTVTEDYDSIPDYPLYKRVTITDVGKPAPDMKMVTVTVYWKSDVHSTSFTTILAE